MTGTHAADPIHPVTGMEPTTLATPQQLTELARSGVRIPPPRRETYLPQPVQAVQAAGLSALRRQRRRWSR